MNDNIEIMAPVGCWESLQVAIVEGANSVYFGVDKLNMRAKSSVNFTLDDMAKIVALCKQHYIKTYLTLNTVMYPEDLPTTLSIVQRHLRLKLSVINNTVYNITILIVSKSMHVLNM